jgi:hypothetical protein
MLVTDRFDGLDPFERDGGRGHRRSHPQLMLAFASPSPGTSRRGPAPVNPADRGPAAADRAAPVHRERFRHDRVARAGLPVASGKAPHDPGCVAGGADRPAAGAAAARARGAVTGHRGDLPPSGGWGSPFGPPGRRRFIPAALPGWARRSWEGRVCPLRSTRPCQHLGDSSAKAREAQPRRCRQCAP